MFDIGHMPATYRCRTFLAGNIGSKHGLCKMFDALGVSYINWNDVDLIAFQSPSMIGLFFLFLFYLSSVLLSFFSPVQPLSQRWPMRVHMKPIAWREYYGLVFPPIWLRHLVELFEIDVGTYCDPQSTWIFFAISKSSLLSDSLLKTHSPYRATLFVLRDTWTSGVGKERIACTKTSVIDTLQSELYKKAAILTIPLDFYGC